MLDLPLGSALLDALPAHCQLVLVGESFLKQIRCGINRNAGMPLGVALLVALLALPAGACQ